MGQNEKSTTNAFPWGGILGLLGGVIAAYIGFLGVRAAIEIPIQTTQTAEARLTALGLTLTQMPTILPSPTLTQTTMPSIAETETPAPLLTPVPTKAFELYQISGRPKDELTFCSPDADRRAGIKIIARWPNQGKNGFYIAAQQGMGITHFRIDGWDYIPSTQINIFPYPEDPSGICGYEAKWLAWADSHAIDPAPGSEIIVNFLGDNGSSIVKVVFTVNPDGLGIMTSSLEY